MRLFSAITTLLSLFLFLSCSKKYQESDFLPNPTPDTEDVPLVLTGKIADRGLILRSNNDRKVPPGFVYPNKLTQEQILEDKSYLTFNGIRVVLYSVTTNGDPEQVKYAFDLDVSAKAGVFSGNDLQETTSTPESFSIKTPPIKRGQDYKVLVIANPNTTQKERTAIGKTFKELEAPISLNHQDGDSIYYKDYSFFNTNLVPIKKETLKNGSAQVDVSLVPDHAWVVIQWEDKNTINPNFSFSTTDIAIYQDLMPTKTVMFPKQAEIQLTSGKGALPITPQQELRKLYGPEVLKSMKVFAGGKKGKRTYLFRLPEYVPTNPINGSTIPRVICRIDVRPDNTFKWMESWVYFKNKVYKVDAIKALAKDPKTSEADKKIIARIITPNGDIVESAKKGYQDDDIRYYFESLSWYAVPIQHFSAVDLGGNYPYGRYGVVRNTLYIMNIKSFATFPSATPGAIGFDRDYEAEATSASLSFPERNIIKMDIII